MADAAAWKAVHPLTLDRGDCVDRSMQRIHPTFLVYVRQPILHAGQEVLSDVMS